jgi:hypothetical protein
MTDYETTWKPDRRFNAGLHFNDESDGHCAPWGRDVKTRIQSIAPIGNRMVFHYRRAVVA